MAKTKVFLVRGINILSYNVSQIFSSWSPYNQGKSLYHPQQLELKNKI